MPYYVGEEGKIRAVNSQDLQLSEPFLKVLLGLLPNLMVIVLMGKKAQKMVQAIKKWTDVPILTTHHPSARVFNVWPEKRAEVAEVLKVVAKIVAEDAG